MSNYEDIEALSGAAHCEFLRSAVAHHVAILANIRHDVDEIQESIDTFALEKASKREVDMVVAALGRFHETTACEMRDLRNCVNRAFTHLTENTSEQMREIRDDIQRLSARTPPDAVI